MCVCVCALYNLLMGMASRPIAKSSKRKQMEDINMNAMQCLAFTLTHIAHTHTVSLYRREKNATQNSIKFQPYSDYASQRRLDTTVAT